MRLIDAEQFDVYCIAGKSEEFMYGVDHVLESLDNATTIDAEPQWIPVTERLPEVYRDKYGELIPFLVCLKDTDYPFRAFFDGKTWGDGCFKLSVVAWMPLPEPYKMDEKDGDGE